jgi:replicative DNA helicase
MDLPVVAGCQVSRSAVSQHIGNAKDHTNFIPRAHHLRDSGRIEEVARSIWFVHRPWKWNNDEDKTAFWLNVDKQTHGTTGILKMKCDLQHMTITDKDTQREEQYEMEQPGY